MVLQSISRIEDRAHRALTAFRLGHRGPQRSSPRMPRKGVASRGVARRGGWTMPPSGADARRALALIMSPVGEGRAW